ERVLECLASRCPPGSWCDRPARLVADLLAKCLGLAANALARGLHALRLACRCVQGRREEPRRQLVLAVGQADAHLAPRSAIELGRTAGTRTRAAVGAPELGLEQARV